MKAIKISSFPPGKDIKRFKNLKEERSKIINKTDPDKIPESFKIKELGEKLHPGTQKLIIKNIVEMNNDVKIFYFANFTTEYSNRIIIIIYISYITAKYIIVFFFIIK